MNAHEAHIIANAYVWGFQDAGGDTTHSAAYYFARAYSTLADEYANERAGSRPPVQDAWKAWQVSGVLTYRGPGGVDMMITTITEYGTTRILTRAVTMTP